MEVDDDKDCIEETMLLNLEIVKVVREKSKRLGNLQAQLLSNIDEIKREKSNYIDCKKQLILLRHEKKFHEEALIQIDNDLKQLQNFMACSDIEINKAKKRAIDILDEFNPLKDIVNNTRASIGLDLIPDLKEVDVLYS
ncbi:zinc finger C4H2 domain-containing protein isoform X1 [Hydra vulgaris]|uniref:zinc finger C4H2 domain-containing protein isoform X1 n=1 Tax=Hydra vulgaris TaxID=6087 RepID=UPI0001924DB9|nr:zinc finger C4H2 domain-containing protein isoform X1 [Hydra vulgaris]